MTETSPPLRAWTQRGEEAALVAVQSALAGRPGVLAGARALSHFGEHSIGWLAVAAVGAQMTHPSARCLRVDPNAQSNE